MIFYFYLYISYLALTNQLKKTKKVEKESIQFNDELVKLESLNGGDYLGSDLKYKESQRNSNQMQMKMR